MKEQIEEMAVEFAKINCNPKGCYGCNLCDEYGSLELNCEDYLSYRTMAETFYNAGYRKQKENTIELPCKIGDTVYIIDEIWDETAEPYVLDVEVLQFFINKNGIAVDLKLPLGLRRNSWMVIGKNVFLTEEEAEEALAKMKSGAE